MPNFIIVTSIFKLPRESVSFINDSTLLLSKMMINNPQRSNCHSKRNNSEICA